MLDAVPYFFTNLLLHNFLLALISFLLGLLLGWLLWAKYKKLIADFEAKQKRDAAEIKDLKAKLDGEAARIKELEEKLAACKSEKSSLGDTSQLDADLAKCKAKCSSLQLEVDSLNAKVKASASAPSVVPIAAPVVSDTQTKSRSYFDNDIASGKMREDEKYGLLYNSAPDKEDDLTKIHGVAGVLNKTLNEYGVYTYRQIALWTPKICDDFSEKIAFPGRVERDNWIDQCKEFHKEKYGEDI